mgnify:CR=1 FL=1
MKRKNPFLKEVERQFGTTGFELSSFLRGNKKLKITKDEIDYRYDITMDEFAYYAEISGYKVLSDEDSLVIFK